jgi:hypothetical protein
MSTDLATHIGVVTRVVVGWDLTLLGLARHLESGKALDSKQEMESLTTPEGKDFIQRSSDDWGRASTAWGTDAAAARAAAQRTTAFYTGEASTTET